MKYIHHPAGDIMSEMKLTDAIFGRPLGNVSNPVTFSENKIMVNCIWTTLNILADRVLLLANRFSLKSIKILDILTKRSVDVKSNKNCTV